MRALCPVPELLGVCNVIPELPGNKLDHCKYGAVRLSSPKATIFHTVGIWLLRIPTPSPMSTHFSLCNLFLPQLVLFRVFKAMFFFHYQVLSLNYKYLVAQIFLFFSCTQLRWSFLMVKLKASFRNLVYPYSLTTRTFGQVSKRQDTTDICWLSHWCSSHHLFL